MQRTHAGNWVDGLTHQWVETIIKDEKKQTDLESVGFTVFRFTDDEILNNINSVQASLAEWIEKKMQTTWLHIKGFIGSIYFFSLQILDLKKWKNFI